MSRTPRDWSGHRFGRLVAVQRSAPGNAGHTRWLFRCDCGTERTAFLSSVVVGDTTSCGCYGAERRLEALTRRTLAEKFWCKVAKTRDDGCWDWNGTRNPDGYGRIRLREAGPAGISRTHFAHRISWILTHGPIPSGLWVLHKCDNPPCVRPDHLFLGTVAENVADMMAKGRRRANPPRGERHWNAKLTAEAVAEIVRTDTSKRGTVNRLADKFGVARSTIQGVAYSGRWKQEATMSLKGGGK